MNLDLFKMGYVLLYKRNGKGFFTNAIVQAQKDAGFSKEDAEFTHVEISGGEIHSIFIRPPRATLVDITQAHRGQVVRVLRPRIYDTDPLDRKRLKVAYISACQSNLGYDWLGILKFKIPFMFHEKKAFFCSEGCTYSIQHQFPMFFDADWPYTRMPAHFNDPKYLDLVWEGVIE